MLSMTGYGRGSAPIGEGRIVLEIKSVNHRFLDIRCRAPKEMLAIEALVEQLLRKRMERGYFTVNVQLEGGEWSRPRMDSAAVISHLKSLVEVGREMDLCLTDLIPVLAGAPDLFVPPSFEENDLKKTIETAFDEAIVALMEMRRAEGRSIAKDFAKKLATVSADIEELARHADTWPPIALKRVKEKIENLFVELKGELEPWRLEAETALLIDKADINEEIIRLRSHCDQMRSLPNAKKPVGRQAEFLIQEIIRELNTIGSKATLTEIRSITLKIKTELEKLRELVQNIE